MTLIIGDSRGHLSLCISFAPVLFTRIAVYQPLTAALWEYKLAN